MKCEGNHFWISFDLPLSKKKFPIFEIPISALAPKWEIYKLKTFSSESKIVEH